MDVREDFDSHRPQDALARVRHQKKLQTGQQRADDEDAYDQRHEPAEASRIIRR